MKLSCTKSLILFICGVILFNTYAFAQEDEEELSASSSYPVSTFTVPDKLRNRVNFWKSVFVDYGENDIIVHHRMYPQSVFSVVDISDVTDGYSDVQRELYRKKKEEEIVKTVKNAFKNIIEQGEPATILEERIYKSMKAIPGGSSKFERAIDEDLIRTQLGIRERYRQAIIESGRYLPLMEQIFRNYGLPVELTRLPFVESSFNLKAKSSVGALGLWQFMAATAKSYMTVNSLVDERRDPIISTHAAAKYFLGAKARLGSWPFAITSYNHGVSGMARKISQIGLTNIADIIEHPSERVLGFASNNFYPSFLAAVEVYREKEEYFPKIKQDRVIRYKERALADDIYFYQLAKMLGVDAQDLKDYNPALSDIVTEGRVAVPAGYKVRVPIYESDDSEKYQSDKDNEGKNAKSKPKAIISDSSDIEKDQLPQEEERIINPNKNNKVILKLPAKKKVTTKSSKPKVTKSKTTKAAKGTKTATKTKITKAKNTKPVVKSKKVELKKTSTKKKEKK